MPTFFMYMYQKLSPACISGLSGGSLVTIYFVFEIDIYASEPILIVPWHVVTHEHGRMRRLLSTQVTGVEGLFGGTASARCRCTAALSLVRDPAAKTAPG